MCFLSLFSYMMLFEFNFDKDKQSSYMAINESNKLDENWNNTNSTLDNQPKKINYLKIESSKIEILLIVWIIVY